jgi:4-amino-4-deoxy-L-arabinose transferase-like glycosyltransferase
MAKQSVKGDLTSARNERGALPRFARIALLAIVLLYIILAVLYSYATRLKWGPDEPAHFVYIQSAALDFRLPKIQGDEARYIPGQSLSHQRQQPPLYYVLAAVPYRLLARLPEDTLWIRLRWFSILVGLAALALQWRLLRLVFPKDLTICLASLALLAFLPMFTYITSVVNNDGLTIVAFIAVLYQWCRILSGKSNPANILLAGVLTGFAILTKESAIALLPGLLIVALASPSAGKRGLLLRRLGRAALALAAAAVICGGWFAYNLATEGTPTVYAYVRPLYHTLAEALADPYGTPEAPGLIAILGITVDRTFMFLWLPWWAVQEQGVIPVLGYKVLMAILCLLAFIGLMLALMDRWRRKTGLSVLQAQALGLMLLTVVTLIAGIVRYVLFVDYTALQAGRYLIVVWPLLSIMGAVGLGTLLGKPKVKKVVLAVLAAAWLAGNLLVLWLDYLTYHP